MYAIRLAASRINNLFPKGSVALIYQPPSDRHAYVRLFDMYACIMPKTVWPNHLIVLNIRTLLVSTTGKVQTSEFVRIAHTNLL
jgi:hypothetical protein